MRINCPFCGSRDSSEFTFRGDAEVIRPDGQVGMFEYTYLRDNPAGLFREQCYHHSGCRNWVIVTRDTVTHAIYTVDLAKPNQT